MDYKNLITLEELERRTFTPKEIERIHKEANERIAQRALRELRKEFGLTQEELSTKSGIPRTTITKIETGAMNVSIGKLTQLANAMNADLQIQFIPKSN
ncbi:MAG: hypothetical protein UR96_C0015G0004 [candidate division WS6 bacterium GW2011_GWC1_36_11]|uniref:HTH cro/C1-type domain-containing protein n=3 Tax=Candidatus Dojkabacteria TaxID=74243 RepID=A0A0G0GL89_9BACT|nr:MAG: hypothetical protein UR96_C0015G0004 [candidate division WS6 bacterium GW2011_GWC1_36_11]KKQ02916.1 MAG: hypothetical protein US14_C0042G0007 [candidate division WS6 bacterium GW2011_WS6_36_26]KKQ10967.1 MAG: hypothetical protein US24_C0048G0004 [candidate division WS6 bacterium GW2011_GWC2_36_7]KKQ15475.1 MAG: hypothetical protein US29_C0043G0004 [candidate division WS6 bacterium GW2011_GWF1_36_8]HAM37434.1 hypothetical protein [Patescibacteria group bacterium]